MKEKSEIRVVSSNRETFREGTHRKICLWITQLCVLRHECPAHSRILQAGSVGYCTEWGYY